MKRFSLLALILASLAFVACNNMSSSSQKEKEKKCGSCEKPCEKKE